MAFILLCNNCGLQRRPDTRIHKDAWGFCPRCGAKMGEPDPLGRPRDGQDEKRGRIAGG